MAVPNPSPPTPCLICGYDLAGLDPEHNCPECGAPAIRSLSGSFLRGAPLNHLARLRTGALALLIVALLSAATQLIASLIHLARPQLVDVALTRHILGSLWSLSLLCLALFGWFRLTDSEEAPWRHQDQLERVRRRLRIAAVFTAGVIFLARASSVALWIQLQVDPISLTTWMTAIYLLFGAMYLLYILAFFLAAIFLRGLCNRIGNQELIRAARRLIWLVPLVFGSIWLAQTAITILGPYLGWRFNGDAVVGLFLGVAHLIAYITIWVTFLCKLWRELDALWRAAAAGQPAILTH